MGALFNLRNSSVILLKTLQEIYIRMTQDLQKSLLVRLSFLDQGCCHP